ncbi:uncharacterized protein LOC111806926 [Cucurbita pepo subsp. pepo]|uniref:uncharacterized protein LOC111806925 n=1 Tax=Cucurbita pepo subsp. pepo TaxID=3664 RepID=UPI000C9DA241|nr:uncharacterized protein LOC111806925 [Cucurbita pepo subsp. pepo]XP_023548223.1 uncharacterized protein LOC111806926 [Cucurbita pepo subsp. pepo]
MEDYYCRRNYIPSFGNWEWNDHLRFSHCFESSRIAGYPHDTDLYVTGDLYENDVVTPAMIVVPRHRRKREKQGKQGKKANWMMNMKETESPPHELLQFPRPKPKPVDEDLYKIPPELLAKSRKKRGLSFFANWFVPNCLI